MSQPAADRNLLFGVLALQLDFISREQLIAAMQAWVADKAKSLGEVLHGQNALAADNRELLEALVAKHLAQHDNDAEKSLAAISSISEIKTALLNLADPDVQVSVSRVSTPSQTELDPYATVAPAAAKATLQPVEPVPNLMRKVNTSAGRFRILRPHARGGLGEVSVAQDEELHREVALKEILGKHADDHESRARFLLEAEITGGLEHPGIVPVYGLGTYADGRPYYAMRFIRGDSLKDAIERFHRADDAGIMDPGQRTLALHGLLGRFVDVCNAIHYAHSRGVLHRDLKPGNIMLGKYGETLVVDWGLAKPLGLAAEPHKNNVPLEPGEGSLMPSSCSASETMAGSAVGTPQYMSPEQAMGKLDQIGPASDVYSLGATLFCVLTGRPPLTDRSAVDVIQKVVRGEIPKAREIKASTPAPLEAICTKAMAAKKEDRYVTPRELADDIEHWLADEPVSAWTEPWTVKTRRWIGRHRTLVTGVAAAVVVALVAFAILTVVQTAAKEREAKLKTKAEENYQLARGAVDRYLSEVETNDALNNPNMEPLKKKLLEAAKEYNQKFVEIRRDDPTVKVELAKATFRLGLITGELDSQVDAIKQHEEAAKLLEDLPPDRAGDIKADLGACYHHLGRLCRLTDKISASEKWYKEAMRIWDGLVKDQPKSARFRDAQARTMNGLGNLYQYMSKLEPARAEYQKAIDIWDDLHKADPKKNSYRRDLGIAHNNLGMIYKRIPGKEEDAKKSFANAAKLQEQLVAESPKGKYQVVQYQSDLAKTEFNQGEEAKAAARMQELVKLHPAVVEPHRTLAEAWTSLVNVYARDKDFAKAEESAKKAIVMKDKLARRHKEVPSFQNDLARGYVALASVYEVISFKEGPAALDKAEKEFKNAERILEEVVRIVPDVPHYQRDLANCLNGLGRVYVRENQKEKADAAFRSAFEHWEKLIKNHGAERDYNLGLYQSCLSLGNLLVTGTNPADALTWYQRALKVAPEADKAAIKKIVDKLSAT